MNNVTKLTAIAFGCLLISACGDKPYSYDGYVGSWQESATERKSYFSIYKSDNAYFFDAKHETDMVGQARKPMVLSFNEGQMRFGNAVLSLSEDANTIALNDKSFNRVDEIVQSKSKNKPTPLRSDECVVLHKEYREKKEHASKMLEDPKTNAAQYVKVANGLKAKYNKIFVNNGCATDGIVLRK